MFRMTVSDIFVIKGRGLVATGKIEQGSLRVGDEVRVNGAAAFEVTGIEMFRKRLDEATAGDNVGVLLKKASEDDVKPGDVLSGGTSFSTAGDVGADHDAAQRALGRDPG